jgi:dTDP-4-amino-4,6-dideoxygalactose transaminase
VDPVAVLERVFAARSGAAGAVAAGFGRAALRLAVEAALPATEGWRDVLVPDFTCAQVAEAVRAAGARPRFFPVARDLRVPAESLRRRLEEGAAAAILPHYFGEVLPDVDQLAAACRAAGVLAIEDCALALDAVRDGRRAGSFGDLAVFSFTKSEWCYGGGIVTAKEPLLAARLAELARQRLKTADGLAFRYGLLRRVDFLANRPRWAAASAFTGKWLERAAFGGADYFEAGRTDAAMSPRAARRALQILSAREPIAAAREHLRDILTAGLAAAPRLLHPAEARRVSAGAFLLLQAPCGDAAGWRERAAREGVTLRLSWAAYQRQGAGPESEDAEWLARHLLLLELHPRLTAQESLRIVRVLRRLEREASTR